MEWPRALATRARPAGAGAGHHPGRCRLSSPRASGGAQVKLVERQQGLDAELLKFHDLWHPQPFREPRPPWCERWPSLRDELMALPEADIARLNDNCAAALALLSRHIPDL